jgi:DUF3037 family protein
MDGSMSKFFEYFLVRFTGDPSRGEAVNVAVVVVEPDTGVVELRYNPSAQADLKWLWPEFDRSSYLAFIRDLRAAVGATHQMMLAEGSARPSAVQVMESISALSANQFSVSPARRFRGPSIHQTADGLYERFVERQRRKPRRRDHVTRSQLRNMITAIFSEWARERIGFEFRKDEEIAGGRGSHHADLVAYKDGKPELVFFALPTGGGGAQWSLLVRDSLPTIVADVREIQPDVRFFAVLPDDATSQHAIGVIERYRRFLEPVDGLTVARLSDLRSEFEIQTRAVG